MVDMLSAVQVNDKLLRERLITERQHAGLKVRNGQIWDDAEATFDLTEQGDVKLRGSFVVFTGYALRRPVNADTVSIY